MCKFLSNLFLFGFFFWNLTANAQILNGNFEQWSSCKIENPSGFSEISNVELNRNGACLVNVTKVVGINSGSTAMKMETISLNNETQVGYAVIGKPSNNGIAGGIPFASKPDSLKGIVKYNIAPKDTAILLVQFKKNGQKINEVFQQFAYSSNGFEEFTIDIPSFNLAPDTLVIIFTSSVPWDNGNPVVGSTITWDSLQFVYDIADISKESFPNSSFDKWETVMTEKPYDWYGQQNLKKVSGMMGEAIELTTSNLRYEDSQKKYYLDASFGNFKYINCNSGGPCDKAGGSHITVAKDTLVFYYKYAPALGSLDSASVYLSFMLNHQEKKSEWKTLLPSPDFQYVEVPFDLTGLGFDTLAIEFRSSKYPHSAALLGSKLTIDHLYLKSDITLSVNETVSTETLFYPNPTENTIHFSGKNIQSIIIKDVNGKMIVHSSALNSIDCSSWIKGIYFISIIKNNGTQIHEKLIVK